MEQEAKLPLHWSCHFDNFQQSIYYYNENDDVTQWERPYQCETQLSLAEHDPMWYDVKSCRAASQMPQHMLQSAPSSAQSHFIEDDCASYSDMEVDETLYTSRSNSPEEGHHFSVYRFASSELHFEACDCKRPSLCASFRPAESFLTSALSISSPRALLPKGR